MNEHSTPEPVAARYFNQFDGWVVTHIAHAKQLHLAKGYPMQLLYTEPPDPAPPPEGLSIAAIKSLWLQCWPHSEDWRVIIDFARAIEAYHNVKRPDNGGQL